MTHGSLFTGGAAGFDNAAEYAGIKTIWQCEKDPFALQLLEQNFIGVTKYRAIEEMIDDIDNIERADIISGGFPCQPFSTASRNRRGKFDDRYLWPQMRTIIEHLRPRWVLAENVVGITSLELPQIISDLDALGYDLPRDFEGNYIIPSIPAAGVGAAHVRQRIFIIAFDERTQLPDVSNTHGARLPGGIFSQWFSQTDRILQGETVVQSDRVRTNSLWEKALTPHILRDAYGIPRRINRIKSLGNAVVPQIPYIIFQMIKILEENNGY